MNGLPVKLKVDIGEVSKELALDRSVEACPAIANVDHRNFKALLKNQPNELLDHLVAYGGYVLSLIGISSEHCIGYFPRMEALNEEPESGEVEFLDYLVFL